MTQIEENEDLAEHLTSFLTFRMARTQNKLNAQITHYLKVHSDIGLVDWRVLRLLDAMGNTTMSKLARLLQMDKGQLSRKIAGLVKRDLITSRTDDVDSRQQILHIDTAGRALVAHMLPKVRRRHEILIDGIPEKDIEVFLDVLARIDAASERRDPL